MTSDYEYLADLASRIVAEEWPRTESQWCSWATRLGLPVVGTPVPNTPAGERRSYFATLGDFPAAVFWAVQGDALAHWRVTLSSGDDPSETPLYETATSLRDLLDRKWEQTDGMDSPAGLMTQWSAQGLDAVLSWLPEILGPQDREEYLYLSFTPANQSTASCRP